MNRTTLFCALLLCLPLTVFASEPAELLDRGNDLMRSKQYDAAFNAYSEANKLSGNKCSRCLVLAGYAKGLSGQPREGVRLIDKGIKLANEASERADAHQTKGTLLMAYWKADPEYSQLAEREFRAALADAPQMTILHAKLGLALGRQKKDPEAVQELKAYLSAEPNSDSAAQVREWIANPRRMRAVAAPPFRLTTLSGDVVELSALAGKVVVLDFWATWCPPCVESVGELKELRKKYSDTQLVILSISADRDQKQWEQFITKKKMDWLHYLDSDKKMSGLFDISGYPTYVLIDRDGLVAARVTGMHPMMSIGGRLNVELKELIPD